MPEQRDKRVQLIPDGDKLSFTVGKLIESITRRLSHVAQHSLLVALDIISNQHRHDQQTRDEDNYDNF